MIEAAYQMPLNLVARVGSPLEHLDSPAPCSPHAQKSLCAVFALNMPFRRESSGT